MPFRDVIGHRRIVGLLTRSIRENTLPPSLILAGPSGVGKRLVALSAAQALNCTAPSNGDACGTCATCTRIARGIFPDVIVLEPGESGSIKVEPVRDLIEQRIGYRPFEGRRRVVIIDQADALVVHAQNALLKSLEEPPSATVFLLVTSTPDTLLATVRSRCPRLQFRPLDAADLARALVERGRSEAEARAIAATANGSLGVALAAAGTDVVSARDVAVRVLSQAATSDEPRRRIDLARDLLAKTGAGSSAGTDREQLAVHLRAMSSILRDVELISMQQDGLAPLANADVRPALDRLRSFHGQRGVDAFEAVDRALVALDRNAGVKLVADWLVLHL